jgi:hypothetical protein
VGGCAADGSQRNSACQCRGFQRYAISLPTFVPHQRVEAEPWRTPSPTSWKSAVS